MKVSIYQKGKLAEAANAYEAIKSLYAVQGQTEHKPHVLAFTGAGGKTTLIYELAREAALLGEKVLIVTTTHMQLPKRYSVLQNNTAAIMTQLEREQIAVAGIPCGNEKIGFIDRDVYEMVCGAADLVLVEADGSKHLPLKAFGAHEPVLPDNTDLILCLAGLSALGKGLQDNFFRLKEAEQLVEKQLWTVPQEVLAAFSMDRASVTPEILSYLWQQGCLQPLAKEKNLTKPIPVIPVLNQADTAAIRQQAVSIFQMAEIENGLIMSCLGD
jgi:xanthine dehydrogenase accessory factor